MEFNNRKINRLKSYDYSTPGFYFLTICTKNKKQILWKNSSNNSKYVLSFYGKIVENEIKKINEIYDGNLVVDKYVVMPNHVHVILKINGRPQVAPTISRVIKQFKGAVTKKIGYPIWQKTFHDHIIRNEKEYNMISQYIEMNPFNWNKDCFYIM